MLCSKPVSAFRNKGNAVAVTAVYRAIVCEVEKRRLSVGISMERMSELMGAADRSYSKMVHADTPSGRIARWETLQSAIDVLFCDGFRLSIDATETGALTSAGARRRIRSEAARWGVPSGRRHMAELGTLSGEARRSTDCSEQRRRQCAEAGRARWARVDQTTKNAHMARVRSAKDGKRASTRIAA